MMQTPKRSQVITLTLLATISVSVAGCDDQKSRARRDNACRIDPQSEDCLNGGRSHSGMSYFFFGRQPFGQPPYYGTPGYAAMQSTAATQRRGFLSRSFGWGRGSSSASPSSPSSSGSWFSGGRSGGSSIGSSEGGLGAGGRGGFGASAAGHAGGGE